MSTDLKKLKRAGVEPARVFGRRDFDPKGSQPVLHYQHNAVDYFSPGYPTWMVVGDSLGECKVLTKAIERYGVEEAPVSGRWQEFGAQLFSRGSWVEEFDPEVTVDYALSNGVVFVGYKLTLLHDEVVPATPVMYAFRRFGDDIEWTSSAGNLRGHVEGCCAVVIRTIPSGAVSIWTPPVSEAA